MFFTRADAFLVTALKLGKFLYYFVWISVLLEKLSANDEGPPCRVYARERKQNALNRGHYVLPTTAKGNAHTSLGLA